MVRVGYLEGTDPMFLIDLTVRGVDTVPLSNGVDGHGKFVGHMTKADEIDVVVGYLHKVIPLSDSGLTPSDILQCCRVHNIPALVVAQKELHTKAIVALGDARNFVTLVDPAELAIAFNRIMADKDPTFG